MSEPLHHDPFIARKIRMAKFYLRWGYPLPIDLQVQLLELGIDVGELERNHDSNPTTETHD